MPIAAAPTLEKVEHQTTAARVERVIRDAILRGEFQPGDKLPPEREFASTLGVTRVTLRSALARLGAAGLVGTVQGDGHRVRDVLLHGGLDRLPDMAGAFANDSDRVADLVRDLLALRRLVMAEAAAICATRTASELAPLRDLVSAMELAIADSERYARLDLAFGRTLLSLSGNLAFQLTYNTMIAFAEEHHELMQVLYADREILLEAARSLLMLLAHGDAALARTAVLTALEALDENRVAKIRGGPSRRGDSPTKSLRPQAVPRPRKPR